MSYDIRFAVKVAGAPEGTFAVIGEPEYDSPTYNLGVMFRKAMGWDFKQGHFYAMNDVLPKIERGIHELKFNAKAYVQYEPGNGWGDIEGALKTLEAIVKWFTSWDGLQGSWNADLPMECIYMGW